MAISLQQVMRQTQRLIMTPQMQQSIQLLQLNSMELEQMIHEEMMENPFLELVDDEENLRSKVDDPNQQDSDSSSDDSSGLSDQEKEKQREVDSYEDNDYSEKKQDSFEDDHPLTERDDYTKETDDFDKFEQNDMDWDSEYRQSDSIAYASTHEDLEDNDFTTYTALNDSLYDSLRRQLHLSVLEGHDIEIGEFIVGSLGYDGFLDCSLENQCLMLGYPPDLIEIKGGVHADERLRQILEKLQGEGTREHVKQLKRKQLVATVVGELLKITADEAMAMSRKDWMMRLIARRLPLKKSEVLEMSKEDLILESIAVRMKVDSQRVFDVLEVIHDFEPTGVGARNLSECLRLQCEEKGIRNRLLYIILDDYLSDLQQKRFREIARALEVTESQVQEVFHIISRLDPRPGQSTTKDTPRYIKPDVYVKKVEGKFMYFLQEGDAGKLRVASSYKDMIHQKAKRAGRGANVEGAEPPPEKSKEQLKSEEDGSYAHDKFKNAVWLIKNIEKRKSTVLRVTEAIMNYQKDFLEKGIEYLHPLTLRNIAEVVGMHESTIARVTTGKYVETPRGIFELKYFFSSGLETDSGEDASSRSIKELITQMIDAENERKPLSDQKIADMLKDKGIQIARRTVAKYREQLKILPAKLRKTVAMK